MWMLAAVTGIGVVVVIAVMLVLGRHVPSSDVPEMRVVTDRSSPLTVHHEPARRGPHWFFWLIGVAGFAISLFATLTHEAPAELGSGGCMDGLTFGLGGAWDFTPVLTLFGTAASTVWLLGCVLASLVMRRRAPY
ncbi:MAG: hypothetical protein AB7O24_08040 [Kofleriaceae bacterium]